ncbi:MAG: anhydro-N-acetylmuramic acid kinase [Pseudomonadota bacterium]|nr:anhydro-N-acetylmuramic acid kinase [Pseudomonadota bacterium]
MSDSSLITAIGLMSGTSMDGIDAALIHTDGHSRVESGPFLTASYTPEFRQRLRFVLGEGKPEDAIQAVEQELTDLHIQIVNRLLQDNGISPASVDVIGFHGHTIHHAPERRFTRQIGDGDRLAAATGIDVVNDLRIADVKAGGQGAPLVPVFHQVIAASLEKPLAILNIGGVANNTWLGAGEDILAFDTGPGNALLDDWMLRHTGQPVDQDGQTALRGKVHQGLIDRWLEHPYFSKKPPKSLDRNAFPVSDLEGLSAEDGAATLAAFTVATIKRGVEHMPQRPRRWLVTGGGRLNQAIMQGLRQTLQTPVDPVETVGWNGDALEGQAFACLAVRSLRGLPLSFPSLTGVPEPMRGGVLCRGRR